MIFERCRNLIVGDFRMKYFIFNWGKICFSSISQTAACRVIDPKRRYQSIHTDKDPFLGISSRTLYPSMKIDFIIQKILHEQFKTNGIGYNLDEIPSHKSNTKSYHNEYKRSHCNRLEYSPKDHRDKISFFLQTIFFCLHSTIGTFLNRCHG